MSTFVLFGPDGRGQRLIRGAALTSPGPDWVEVTVPFGTPVHAIRREPDGRVIHDPDIPATQI